MQRLWSIIGGVLVVAAMIGVLVATQVDFNGEGTLASRVPLAGDVLDGLARSAGGPGGGVPMLQVGDGRPDAPSCGEVYATAPQRRASALADITTALRDAGAEEVTGEGVATVMTIACQLRPASERADDALAALLGVAEEGRDPLAEICTAYEEDIQRTVAVISEPRRRVFARLTEVASDDSDPALTHPALRDARREALGVAAEADGLELRTHAGREFATLLAAVQREVAAAHARWLAGAPTPDAWLAGPAGEGAERWFAAMDAIGERLATAEQDNPDLILLPAEAGCAPRLDALGA